MSLKDQIEKSTEELLLPITQEHHYELVDVEYVKEGANWYLRAYVDKDGGITVDDCEIVSRALEVKLDEADLIKIPYILEVSSPGLDRPLKKEKDFRRSIGKKVEVRLYKAINKEKELVGILQSFDETKIVLELSSDNTIEILKSDIALIRLYVEF